MTVDVIIALAEMKHDLWQNFEYHWGQFGLLKRIPAYLSQLAILSVAGYLEKNSREICDRWLESLRREIPRYYSSAPDWKEQSDHALALLLSTVRSSINGANADQMAQVSQMGRDIATSSLERGLSIEETLEALSLLRGIVLGQVHDVVRRQFWLVVPGDVLRAVRVIDHAVDLQMSVVAQAYVEVRDALVRENRVELEVTNEQLLRLHDLSKAVAASLNLETALDSIADAVTKLLDCRICGIALVDKSTEQLVVDPRYGHRGLLPESVPEFSSSAADALGNEVLGAGNVRMVSNVKGEPVPYLRELPDIGSIMCAPLRVQDRTLGVIYAADRRIRHFDGRAAKLLVTLANHAAVALDNALLYEEAQHRSEVLSTLMQEMHHRIKNNLHTVVDLLTLQGVQQGCDRATKCLGDSIGRVKSIAAVHELLSADNISQTDIKKLVLRLADISTKNKMRSGQTIRVLVQGVSIYLPSKQATCLALVLNELLDNAVEHAFPDRNDGEIVVDLAEDGQDVVVVVKDSGVGMQDLAGVDRRRGLGLAIAISLVEKDLMGSLILNGTVGTEATIRFCK